MDRRPPAGFDADIVGVDNGRAAEYGTDLWNPGKAFLTGIRQPFERIGAEAVDLLIERREAGVTRAFKQIMLDAPLHVDASTRPPGTPRRPDALRIGRSPWHAADQG